MAGHRSKKHDIFIIGGGINGCGIARDAAGRGYSVYLAEKNDLASGTSSAATKLIHGGLRYLEHYEFRLVRESLMERETLWSIAPHLVEPLRFVLPHHRDLRPAWLLRLGLFLYDHMGGRKLLPPTRVLNMKTHEVGKPLKPIFKKGFEYSDCWVNDARMVVLNARDAAIRGASINTRTKVVSAIRKDGVWEIDIEDTRTGETSLVLAKVLVNAAGPWVDEVLSTSLGQNEVSNVRLVRGSHIVVNKMFDHDKCYIFQNRDDRIIFAIPYEHNYTLIGTTDQDHVGSADDARISDSEIDYLINAANEYFQNPLTRDDLVWSYSGVRPLYNDGSSKAQEATREYVLKQEGDSDTGLLINIFGGKITTYRRLAEAVMEKIETVLPQRKSPWTNCAPLPGGDFAPTEFDAEISALKNMFPFLKHQTAERLARSYGTDAKSILGASQEYDDMGQHFGAGLYQREVDYLVAHEWAETAEDILYRRSKLGLLVDIAGEKELQLYLDQTAGSD